MPFQHLAERSTPFIIGHRGGAGPAYENSLAAFRNAARTGEDHCDGVELDVHVTTDHHYVVHHDPTVASGGLIRELSISQVRQERLPDGSPIPLLEEVMAAARDLALFVEVKDLPVEADEGLLELLRSSRHPGGFQIHSFDHRIVARLREREPALQTGVLSSSYPIDPLEQVRRAGATALWQTWELIDQPLADRCSAADIALVAWTVNSTPHAERLLRMGVRALCGDWPGRLRRAGTG